MNERCFEVRLDQWRDGHRHLIKTISAIKIRQIGESRSYEATILFNNGDRTLVTVEDWDWNRFHPWALVRKVLEEAASNPQPGSVPTPP